MPKGIFFRTKKHRENIGRALKGRIVSIATRKKIGRSNKGKIGYWRNKKRPPFSEEWKQKMRDAAKGKTLTEVH